MDALEMRILAMVGAGFERPGEWAGVDPAQVGAAVERLARAGFLTLNSASGGTSEPEPAASLTDAGWLIVFDE